jgi:hypothetical protein
VQRASETTKDALITIANSDAVRQEDNTSEQDVAVPLWSIPEYTGTNPITLYDRVYGIKPHGVGKNVFWGKTFLKSHIEYRRQHKKMHKNYCIVREWFLPGTNDFVDQVLQSSSLRWNKVLRKELTKYCEEKRKSGKKKDSIKTLDFPREGISLRWKTSDIVRHVFTIKKYRKSSKGKKSQISLHGDQVGFPPVALQLSTGACEVEAVGTDVHSQEVPTRVAEIGKTVRENRLGKQPRIRNPSLKVREQAS